MMDVDLRLTVNLPDYLGSKVFSVAEVIRSPYVQAFEPVDAVDDPMMTLLSRNAKTESQMRIVRRQRKDLAEDLARHLASLLMQAMEYHDTQNGYTK